ncbi:MAG: nicotinate-nucleotide adenylyltransferase [Bacteroides sp.]|nr:nicotinate-nucleotide adenylyltransferase [Bacteroides sp.]
MAKESMKRTGIFGGSYNPIHIGHLALANYLCEYGELDELWFMVSPQNPFKAQSSDLWDDELRLELVRLAVEDYPKFHASDFEFHLPRPSYMVTTLQKLRETYPDREFILIIGADNWTSFPRWKDADIIMKHHMLMVYPRPGYEIDESTLPDKVQLVQTPLLEVSSTFIRESLKQDKDVRYFLHPKVWEKISCISKE